MKQPHLLEFLVERLNTLPQVPTHQTTANELIILTANRQYLWKITVQWDILFGEGWITGTTLPLRITFSAYILHYHWVMQLQLKVGNSLHSAYKGTLLSQSWGEFMHTPNTQCVLNGKKSKRIIAVLMCAWEQTAGSCEGQDSLRGLLVHSLVILNV